MWRACHNSPQNGTLVVAATTRCPQLATTHPQPCLQLATTCPHLPTICPHLATIRATSYHKLPQLFEYIIQFIRFINRNRALNRINSYFVDCCHIDSRGYVSGEINTGLAVCMDISSGGGSRISCIMHNHAELGRSWWPVVDRHLKPVGYQSLGHHVGWLEA